jgi:hypothetical protein
VELCEKSVQNLMSQSHKFIGKMLDFVWLGGFLLNLSRM